MIIFLGVKMPYITLKCKNCGSDLSINHDSKTITCSHCGSTFLMVDLLDEKDVAFSENLKPQDLENKIEFAEALKQGETYLYQAEYKLAEQSFKRAIELNNKNYKGYFGVVKAKTSNLNKVPDEKDYLEYAKLSIKYVDKDDKVYLESEIVKLDLLIEEKEKQKQAKRALDQKLLRQEKNIRDTETFFGYITIFLILFISGILLLIIFMTGLDNPTDAPKGNTYEISTKVQLEQILQKEDLLSCTIILKADIDFDDDNWTPIGSKETPFSGTIYGNGHKISNLKITTNIGEGEVYSGFIAYAKGASLNGIHLFNVSLTEEKSIEHSTTHFAGLLCGYAESTTISKCAINENCKISFSNQNKCTLTIGGLVGKCASSKIAYSYANVRMTAIVSNIETSQNLASSPKYNIGGLVGELVSSKITNSYSSANAQTQLSSNISNDIVLNFGGLVGYWHTPTSLEDLISNSFFTGKLSATMSCTNHHTYIAGIVAFGSNTDYISNNHALLDADTYKLNGSALQKTDFNDFGDRPNSVIYTSSTYILEDIEQHFSAEIWSNTTSLTPTLRVS